MTVPEMLTGAVALISLLWNVVNAAKLRDHSKALQANEAHLRVTSELRLRLHQQSWDLLREANAASLAAHDAIREYNATAVAALRGIGSRADAITSKDFTAAERAVQTFAGLAHVTPPDKSELREAASLYTTAFNLVSRSILGEPEVGGVENVMAALNDALTAALVGTKKWNEQLWRDQSVAALAKVDER